MTPVEFGWLTVICWSAAIVFCAALTLLLVLGKWINRHDLWAVSTCLLLTGGAYAQSQRQLADLSPANLLPGTPKSAPVSANPTAADATAIVHCQSSGRQWGGSAVHIEYRGSRLLVTNRHVAEGANAITLRFPSGRSYRASRLGFDRAGADLALLSATEAKDEPCVTVSSRAPRDGESILLIGYPAGRGPLTRKGSFRGYSAGHGTTDVPVTGGDSGGGLFLTDGTLAGLTNSYRPDYPGQPAGFGQGPTHAQLSAFIRLQCGPGGCPPSPSPRGRSPRSGGSPDPFDPRYQAPPPPLTPKQPDADPDDIVARKKRLDEMIERLGKISAPPLPSPALPSGTDDSRAIRESIARLEKLIESRKPVPGPKGESGPSGPKGDRGDPGKDYDPSLVADVQAMKDEIARLKGQRFKVELVDATGKVVQTDDFGPDRPLRIRLRPVE